MVFTVRIQADLFAAIGPVLHQAYCLILNSKGRVPEYHFQFQIFKHFPCVPVP